MKKLLFILSVIYTLQSAAQTAADKSKILYGVCTQDSLSAEPFGNWFTSNYDNYKPNTKTIANLKKQKTDNISIEIFFGTWCGDSKREVSRFLKLLKEISFTDKKTKLIAVGNADSLVKQSPQHEEAGKGIFRVPTFIIYKNGVEFSRINEYPVFSLEKDLLAILSNQPYTPNYQTFSTIKKWLTDGTLLDENTSAAGLAQQLRLLTEDEGELNSLGYLLLKQNKKKEALQIFRINYYLYPESASILSSLGEGFYENGDYKKAVNWLERSLEFNKEPSAIKSILEILYKAKEKEKSQL